MRRLGNLDALLLMYPRKRQFVRDFPALKATVRADFEGGVPPAVHRAAVRDRIVIESFLQQLSRGGEEKVRPPRSLRSIWRVSRLAERRIGGERDQRGDKVFFATRLCGVALFMAGQDGERRSAPA